MGDGVYKNARDKAIDLASKIACDDLHLLSKVVDNMSDAFMSFETPTDVATPCQHNLVFQYPGLRKYDVYKCTVCGETATVRWNSD